MGGLDGPPSPQRSEASRRSRNAPRPQAPRRSERPGEPVALLDTRFIQRLSARGALVPSVSLRQLFKDVPKRNPARSEKHERVKPEIRDFFDEPPVAFAAERRREDLHRLLADLSADGRLTLVEQADHVGAARPRGLSL